MQCQKSNSINTIYSQAYWDIAVFVQAIEGHKLNLHNCTSYPDMEQMDLWESTFIQYIGFSSVNMEEHKQWLGSCYITLSLNSEANFMTI